METSDITNIYTHIKKLLMNNRNNILNYPT